MKKEYTVSLEDQRLIDWLTDKSEQGINISKLEQAAGLPHKVVARFVNGERKQLGEYREPLLKHLRKHFYFDVYEKNEDNTL